MTIELIILLSTHFLLTTICLSTNVKNFNYSNWYLYPLLLIPILNVLLTITILDIEYESSEDKKNRIQKINNDLSHKVSSLTTEIREIKIKRLNNSIKIGDKIFIPNLYGYAEEIRGKYGNIISIKNLGVILEFDGVPHKHYSLDIGTIISDELFVIHNNTLPPFKFC